ncbi:hypothetical protein HDV00_010217 [Rhizophlyctis rosea]|nr:hypothetical protein HDV00_010217 [Rhizophlyctis rosea]
MLGGSFFAGNIPLAFQFSEERLRLVSTFGSGMLVGTALVVIVPEGVETLYSVQMKGSKGGDTHKSYPQAVVDTEEEVRIGDGEEGVAGDPGEDAVEEGGNGKRADGVAERGAEQPETDSNHNHGGHRKRSFPLSSLTRRDASSGEAGHSHSSETPAFEAHRYIGAALAIGFAFMFLVEHAGHFGHSHNSASHIVSVNDIRDRDVYSHNKMAATIGLVVHAAADGVALGAASASDRGSLEFIVWLAIMLHKAPSSFGLATFLLQEGHPRRTVRQHLLVFSLAAPIAALFTFIILQQYGIEDPDVMRKWTGILLLFSAGTFLYVATVHILPEIYSSGKGGSPGGGGGGGGGAHDRKLSLMQIGCLLGGIFAPLLITVEHSH